MATIWLTVFALPQLFAATTTPASAATSRTDVTINSRKMMSSTSHTSATPSETKQTKAEITMILSASGSMNFPKVVIRFRLRASLPSRWSVYDAAAKIARAIR